MKKSTYFWKIIPLLFFCNLSFAQTVEIFFTNIKTGEKKTYEIGGNIILIPVNYVKGWDKCTANAIKKFQFNGVDTIRGELYCTTEKNMTMSISCVAGKNSLDVTVAHLYDVKFKLIDKDSIAATGSAEITLTCKNY